MANNMNEEIIITFDGADVKLETKGFVGGSCAKATENVERDLGLKTKDVKKPEFHQSTVGATMKARG